MTRFVHLAVISLALFTSLAAVAEYSFVPGGPFPGGYMPIDGVHCVGVNNGTWVTINEAFCIGGICKDWNAKTNKWVNTRFPRQPFTPAPFCPPVNRNATPPVCKDGAPVQAKNAATYKIGATVCGSTTAVNLTCIDNYISCTAGLDKGKSQKVGTSCWKVNNDGSIKPVQLWRNNDATPCVQSDICTCDAITQPAKGGPAVRNCSLVGQANVACAAYYGRTRAPNCYIDDTVNPAVWKCDAPGTACSKTRCAAYTCAFGKP